MTNPSLGVSAEQKSSLVSTTTLVVLCILAFLVSTNYALSRSTIETLYNHVWNKKIEYVWEATAIAVLLIVPIYNFFAVRYNIWAIFRLVSLVSVGLLLLLYWQLPAIDLDNKTHVYSAYEKAIVFLLCMWKDVYIILLIEIFWTFANLVNKMRTARWVYGLFAFMGSFGDFLGNVFSQTINTAHIQPGGWPHFEIWVVAPLMVLATFVSWVLNRVTGPYQIPRDPESQPSFIEGIITVGRSWYLLLLLVVIGLFQIGTGFLEKQLNVILQPMGTAGKIWRNELYIAVSIVSMILGLLSSWLLRLFRAEGILRAIPFFLLLTTVAYLVHPGLWVLSTSYALSKCTNYSVFRWTKELLYLPLTRVEKIQGKASIDMFTYRLGKALAGVMVIGAVALKLPLMSVAAAFWALWLLFNIPLIREYRRRVQSMPPGA